MSALTVIKTIEANRKISNQDVIEKIKEAFRVEFDEVKIDKYSDDSLEIRCRIKTRFFNPIVSIKAPISIKTKENRAKIMIDGDARTNFWFWFALLIGFFMPIIWIVMLIMYFNQKEASIGSLGKVFERMEFDLKDF